MLEDKAKPLRQREVLTSIHKPYEEHFKLTSRYGSFEFVVVMASGLNGGLPPVDQNVPGVGNVRPNANWVSVGGHWTAL